MQGDSRRTLATIMFTDMVGYTALMQQDELLARKKRERHRSVFEELHRKYSGQIIQYFGDGTLSIFSSSVHAVACAIEMQQLLKTPIEVPLRIGLHTGDIVLEEDNLIGDAVNLASRIESFSVPGAVLISDVLYEQVKNQLQFKFRDLGKFHLKNVERPFGIYALADTGLVIPDPARLKGKGRRQSAPNNNLPKVLTSFLGREKEVEEVIELLQSHRLITLTGPGGTGKTRLSIQIAQQLVAQFPDGIFWVPLASVMNVDDVASTIVQYLEIETDVLLSVEEVLIKFFQHKQALLVLDNFEQIVGAAPLLEQLMQSSESLHLLVSSRIVLQLSGEMEYPVPPLNVPKLNGSNTLERLEKVPSVALFAQRAGLTSRAFRLTQDNITTVAEICLRLDGLPLAIELAAARTKIFSPNALLNRLNKRLDVLKGGGQFPPRHQTLRHTIAWSYDLLDTEEKAFFSNISVFVGGSTIEAIEEVCGQNGLSDWDMTDGVLALLDKSLLQSEETQEDKRFFMLETIREFAVETLAKSGKSERLKKAHINYYLKIIEEAAPHLSGAEGDRWNERLFKDQPNFRAAIDYAIELNEMHLAYRLGLALRPFWGSRGLTQEGVKQLEKLAAVPVPEALFEERLRILQALGMLYLYIPIFDKAIPIFEESYAYWYQQEDKRKKGLSLNELGYAYIIYGKLRRGEELSMEALSIFEELGDQSRLVASFNNLGWAYWSKGMPVEAIKYFKQSFQITKELGDQRRNAYVLMNWGYVNAMRGEYSKAEAQILESMVVPRKISDKLLLGHAMRCLGIVKYASGDFDSLLQISDETERLGRESNGNYFVAGAFEHRALALFAKGAFAEAKEWIDQAAAIWKAAKPHLNNWFTRIIYVQAIIALALGDIEAAKQYGLDLLENELEEGSLLGFIPGIEIAARIAALQKDYFAAAQLFFNAQTLRLECSTPIRRSEQFIFDDLLANLENNLGSEELQLVRKERIANDRLQELAERIFKQLQIQ